MSTQRRAAAPSTTPTRKIPRNLIDSRCDPEILAVVRAWGLSPAAVRGFAKVEAQGQSPARSGSAVICRLYPRSPRAALAFYRERQLFAEAVVFEDPDDQLAWNLNAGFENALIPAQALIRATNDQ